MRDREAYCRRHRQPGFWRRDKSPINLSPSSSTRNMESVSGRPSCFSSDVNRFADVGVKLPGSRGRAAPYVNFDTPETV